MSFKQYLLRIPSRYPITLLIVVINICVFLFHPLFGFSSVTELSKWGGLSGLTFLSGEYWRVLTALFIHLSYMNLIINITFIYIFGRRVEYRLGHGAFLLLYFTFSLITVPICYLQPRVTGVGSSAAISGIFGAYGVLTWKYLSRMPHGTRRMVILETSIFAIFLIPFTLSLPAIIHLFGFLVGFTVTHIVVHLSRKQNGKYFRTQLAVSSGIIVTLFAPVLYFPNPEKLIFQIDKAQENAEYKTELVLLNRLIRLTPDVPAMHLKRVFCLRITGQDDLAAADFDQALKLAPSDPITIAFKSEYLAAHGDLVNSLTGLQDAIRLGLNTQYSAFYKGIITMYAGSYSESIKCFSQLMTKNNTDTFGYLYYLGFDFYFMGNMELAEAEWHQSANLSRLKWSKARSLENIGFIYLKTGKWEEALRNARQVDSIISGLNNNSIIYCIAAYHLSRNESDSSKFIARKQDREETIMIKRLLSKDDWQILERIISAREGEINKTK